MSITSPKYVTVILVVSITWGFGCSTARAQAGRPVQAKLTQESLAKLAQLRNHIRPQPGESRWMEIPWLIDVHQARLQAAAEGKPLFVYSGGGAIGIGGC
jgi:hypothetical protein